eukprot:5456808-Amphidinium_carterae.1
MFEHTFCKAIALFRTTGWLQTFKTLVCKGIKFDAWWCRAGVRLMWIHLVQMILSRSVFKNVGLQSWTELKYMVAIWGDEGLDMPLTAPDGSPVFQGNEDNTSCGEGHPSSMLGSTRRAFNVLDKRAKQTNAHPEHPQLFQRSPSMFRHVSSLS